MSNKLNYTPAPWVNRTVGDKTPGCGNYIYHDKQELGVCYYGVVSLEASRANARLMAAAPDMYELLRRVCQADASKTSVEQLAQQAAMLLAKLEAHND